MTAGPRVLGPQRAAWSIKYLQSLDGGPEGRVFVADLIELNSKAVPFLSPMNNERTVFAGLQIGHICESAGRCRFCSVI